MESHLLHSKRKLFQPRNLYLAKLLTKCKDNLTTFTLMHPFSGDY